MNTRPMSIHASIGSWSRGGLQPEIVSYEPFKNVTRDEHRDWTAPV